MESVKYLVIGAGISGLAFANFVDSDDYLILERDGEIGGYCKTVKQDGFVWDYSGHFFHFRHPEIEQYLVDRMSDDEVRVVEKNAQIRYKDRMVDFPFQKNIHQLPQDEFTECLYDLFFKEDIPNPANFREMVTTRFGKGIAEKFLIPYNEKLYACDMSELDADAMGRFFPYADLEGIVRNFREADNHSYNAHFTYPRGGAIQYVNALAGEVDDKKICLNESLLTLDLDQKVATTSTGRTVRFEYVISSAPFDRLVEMSGIDYDTSVFSYNKVMVFNLGFDRKGWEGVHWVYFPERKYCFYRVGFYDNIFDTDRMSLYVEIGYPSDAPVEFDKMFEQTLADLKEAGVTDEHELVSHHRVLLDPAYVHITKESNAATEELRELFKARGVYSVGRYGGWTYCAIEDNIVEARTLANNFNTLQSLAR